MPRMPRFVYAVVALFLLVTVVASGCAAPATQAPAQGAPAAKNTLTIAVENQPTSVDPQDWSGGYDERWLYTSVYDSLVGRDPKTNALIPRLAKSWESVNDTTWRFKLQDGVKFSNGETFDAKAVELAVNRMVDPKKAKPYLGERYLSTLKGAKVVDALTVDIMTTAPDPILPGRAFFLMIGAPGWLEKNPDKHKVEPAPGTGPYKLAEWQRDQFMRLVANETNWGTPKPTINEVKLVYRREPSVRANMVQTGEADIGVAISGEDAKKMPKVVKQETVETVFFKMNTQGSLLEDIRLRKAIAHSIDTKTIIETIYAGVPTRANSVVGPSATGWNPDLQPYNYDVEMAKNLVKEAATEGKEVKLIYRIGLHDKVSELAEAVANYIAKSGLKVSVVAMEAAQWQEVNRSNGPGPGKVDILMSSHGNDLMDSSLSFDSYYRCQGRTSLGCNPAFEAKITPAAAKNDATARTQALRELWKEASELYFTVPLFHQALVHGLGKNVEWQPRPDGYVYFNTVTASK